MPRRFDSVRPFFLELAGRGEYRGPLGQMVAWLGEGSLTPQRRREVLGPDDDQRDPEQVKARLDIVLSYVRSLLPVGSLSIDDRANIAQLKIVLQLREGDFLAYRRSEIAEVLQSELEGLLEDGELSEAEDVQQVALQEAFDLGYDEYLALVRLPLVEAWRRRFGAADRSWFADERYSIVDELDALEALVDLSAGFPTTLH